MTLTVLRDFAEHHLTRQSSLASTRSAPTPSPSSRVRARRSRDLQRALDRSMTPSGREELLYLTRL